MDLGMGLVFELFFSGLALAFGIWQYLSVSREIRRDQERASAGDQDSAGGG